MQERVTKKYLEFDPFSIDVEERVLMKRGRPVPITPKVFDILLTLVENRGRTVHKNDLMDKVWGDTFVYEGNLNRNISTLRKALGDTIQNPRFILTVPKRGYRFAHEVKEISQEEESVVIETSTNYRLAVREMSHARRSRPNGLLTQIALPMAVLLAAFVTVGGVWYSLHSQRAEQQPNIESVRSDIRGTHNSEAHELYKKGRQLWETRSVEDLHFATLSLEQAVEKDPGFALGHAALADAYVFDYANWKRAEAVANEAIRLDPDLGQPYATIGFIRTFWEWQLEEAEPFFKQAISRNPEYATAHQWYAINLAARGRIGMALAEIKRAFELEPGSPSINADYCQLTYYQGSFDQALDQCRKALRVDPNSKTVQVAFYEIHTAMQTHNEAVGSFLLVLQRENRPQKMVDDLRTAYDQGDIRTFWRKRIEFLKLESANEFQIARYYALLGETDEAVDWLERAYRARDFQMLFVGIDPWFQPIAHDERYREFASLFAKPLVGKS